VILGIGITTKSIIMYPVVENVFSSPWIAVGIILLAVIPIYLYITSPPEIPLPGPRYYPFPLSLILNAISLIKLKGNHRLQYELYKKYGKLYKMYTVGRMPTICVMDPDMIKQIMVKEFHKFRNRGLPIEFPPPLDSEMFLAKYPKWKRVRKVLAPAFSSAKLKTTAEFVEEAADRTIQKLQRFVETGIIKMHMYT
jgi:cytochrome P450 family 3 subfamily A